MTPDVRRERQEAWRVGLTFLLILLAFGFVLSWFFPDNDPWDNEGLATPTSGDVARL
jgi:hypothetical protein